MINNDYVALAAMSVVLVGAFMFVRFSQKPQASTYIVKQNNAEQNNAASSRERYMPSVPSATAGDVAVFDSLGNVRDSSYFFSDSVTAPNAIWSGQRVANEIDDALQAQISDGTTGTSTTWSSSAILSNLTAVADVLKPAPGVSGNLLNFSSRGTIQDSGLVVDDTKLDDKSLWSSKGVIDNVINDASVQKSSTWSSTKLSSAFASKDVSPSKTLLVGSGDGNFVSSGFTIDDSLGPASNIIWSSERAEAGKAKIEDGSVQASTTWSSRQIVDTIQAAANVLNQNTAVAGTAGHLAQLGASGKVVDSGFTISDSSAASANVLWTSDKISSAIGSLTPSVASSKNLISVSNGAFTDSGFVVDDAAVSPSTLWSSSKISSLLPKLSGTVGNILTNGANGVVATSSFSIDDSLPASKNILWSSQKAKDSFVSSNGLANSIVSFDSNGNATSNISVNDSSSGTGVLWSSSKIQSKLDAVSQFAAYAVNDSATTASNIWTAQQVQNAVSAAVSVSVAFDAASDQNFSSLNTPITYTITSLNTGNGLNSSSGKFTAPKQGFYFLHWQGVQNDNQGLDVRVFMKLNGSTIMGSYSYQTLHNQLVMSCVRRLNVNDSVWAEINQGSIMSTSSDLFTKFSGFML